MVNVGNLDAITRYLLHFRRKFRHLSPLSGTAAVVTRHVTALGEPLAPEQAISVREALHAYTVGGAVALGDDENRGSLAAGKWADMVVLSGDPLATLPESLHTLRAEATFVGGAVRFLRLPDKGFNGGRYGLPRGGRDEGRSSPRKRPRPSVPVRRAHRS